MSARSNKQTTQLLLMGLAAVAAVGIMIYLSQNLSTPASNKKAKTLDDGDDDDMADDATVKAKGRSVGGGSSPVKATTTTTAAKSPEKSPTSSGPMDEKELHAKIEELDKKGKAFFKNKQVGIIVM